MADKASNKKLFEKREVRGKSTAAPVYDVSNYLSGNIDSSSSLGDNSHLYEDQRSFAILNQQDRGQQQFNRKSMNPAEAGEKDSSKIKGNK